MAELLLCVCFTLYCQPLSKMINKMSICRFKKKKKYEKELATPTSES
jgi:hypothetical protein